MLLLIMSVSNFDDVAGVVVDVVVGAVLLNVSWAITTCQCGCFCLR